MEAGPSCNDIGSGNNNCGCQSCQQQQRPQLGDRMKGMMQAGGSCNMAGCDGGCQSCLGAKRPQLGSRMMSRMQSRQADCGGGCGGGMDCGCGTPTPAPVMPSTDCGCGAPAGTGCGCTASAPASFSMGDMADTGYGDTSYGDVVDMGCSDGSCGSGEVVDMGCSDGSCGLGVGTEVQLVSHDDRRGLLGKLFGGHHKVRGAHGIGAHGFGAGARGVGANGCGAPGCGGLHGLCARCQARIAANSSIPHRDPTIHGGGGAGPAGQIPTYAYPYYTTRAPRDFLDPNPPTIGY